MNALPRPHRSDSSFSVFPNKGWVGSITLIADITRSSLRVFCRVRRRRGRHPAARSAHAPRSSAQVPRQELAPERIRRPSCQKRSQRVIIPRPAAARWGILIRPQVEEFAVAAGGPTRLRAHSGLSHAPPSRTASVRRLQACPLASVSAVRNGQAPANLTEVLYLATGLATKIFWLFVLTGRSAEI
jgi:hypothetical protein